jgi:hypothetical protein
MKKSRSARMKHLRSARMNAVEGTQDTYGMTLTTESFCDVFRIFCKPFS